MESRRNDVIHFRCGDWLRSGGCREAGDARFVVGRVIDDATRTHARVAAQDNATKASQKLHQHNH